MKHPRASLLIAMLAASLPAAPILAQAAVTPSAHVVIGDKTIDISSRIKVNKDAAGVTVYTIAAQDVVGPTGTVTLSATARSDAKFSYSLSSLNPQDAPQKFGFEAQIPVRTQPAGTALNTTLLGELTNFKASKVSIQPVNAGVQTAFYNGSGIIGTLGGAQTSVIPAAMLAPYPTKGFYSASAKANAAVTSLSVSTRYTQSEQSGVSLRGTAGTPTLTTQFGLKATPILPPPANTITDQVAVASLRRDGRPDLISTSSRPLEKRNLLAVRLSDGHGGYAPPVTYPLKASYSSAIVVADFNGDGIPDVLVGSNDATAFGDSQPLANVQVFPGRGNGSLRPPVNTTSLQQAGFVAVGDFNGDGKLDIATTGLQTIGVMVALGRGDGAFGSPTLYDIDDISTLWAIQAADLNRDGKRDLVVARQNGDVTVLPGIGNGTFGPAKRAIVASDTRVSRVFVADFNGDSILDVAAGGDFGGGAGTSIMFGKGDGTFQKPAKVSGLPVLNVADFNGDGKPDLIATSGGPRQVLLNNGDGTFVQSALFYGQSGGMAAADINGDGYVDLVAPSFGVAVTYGNGDGTFQASGTVFSGQSSSSAPYAVALADFNRDGKPDMAVANAQESTVTLFRGDGTGGFITLEDIPVGTAPVALVALDMNRDGKPDLVVVDEFSDDLTLLFGNGDGTFKAPVFLSTGSTPLAVATGDFNGDGIPDLAVANGGANSVSIFLGVGDGTFRSLPAVPVGKFPSGVTVADFNKDGKLDVAVCNQGANTVSVAFGRGDGTFGSAATFAVGSTPYAIASGDLNRDGLPDLVTANNGDSTVSVLTNTGGGQFGAAQSLRVGSILTDPTFVALADLNGDGNLDIVTANDQDESLSILFNQGKGVFAASREYFGGSGPVGLAIGDVNDDGKPDVLAANRFESDVSILLNTTSKAVAPK